MIGTWSLKICSRLDNTSILLLILFFLLLLISGLFYIGPFAQAQVQVIPEEPEVSEVTLKLAGSACDINSAESAVLHLRGVVMVDIEYKKDHLIVGYDPNKVTPQLVVEAIGRKQGCHANILGGGRP